MSSQIKNTLRASIDEPIKEALKRALIKPNEIFFVVINDLSFYSANEPLYKVVDSAYMKANNVRSHFDTESKIFQSYSVTLGYGYTLVYKINS